MTSRGRALSTLLLIAASIGPACRKPGAQAGAASQAPAPVQATSPLEQARALLVGGDADGAIAKLQDLGSEPDVLCLLGAAWAKKAELAPLPTPPPPTPGSRPAAAPEFKPEELKAVEFYERVLQTQPGHPRANMGMAELLAPHSLRRFAPAQGAASRPGHRPTAPPPPPIAGESGPDYRPDAVLQEYRAALQGDPASKEAAEKLYDFAVRVGRLEDADQALQELLRRDREKPEPLIRYGDFLAAERKDPMGAIEQYRQALIWRPDDPETKAKIADIYISQAIDSYGKNQYSITEARLKDAQKYVTDPQSPQGLKIRDYMGKISSIRQPAAR